MVGKILDFVRTYALSLAAGVVALAAAAFAVLGMSDDSVMTELEQRKQRGSRIDGMIRNATNPTVIAAAEARGERLEAEVAEALQRAREMNAAEPLIAGVLPRPATMAKPYEFRSAYEQALRRLPNRLQAGPLPTDDDILAERNNIEQLQQREAEVEAANQATFFGMGGTDPANDAAAAPEMSADPMAGERERDRGRDRPRGRERRAAAPRAGPDEATPGDPNSDPELRAAINRAREIRVYADLNSWHVVDVFSTSTAPDIRDIWFAQMSFWIQTDLVDAFAELNERFAQQSPGAANVEEMPIKRIESIVIDAYRLTNDSLAFPPPMDPSAMRSEREPGQSGRGGSRQRDTTASADASYTGRTSNDLYDVITFKLTLWVDQREILKVIDAVTRANFYQVVGVEYAAATPESPLYLFGSAPVVRLELQCEGYFLRSAFKQWMPPAVAEELGIQPDVGQG